MKTHFIVGATSSLPPEQALARVLDLDRHRPPFTTLRWQRPLRPGSTVVARTSLGPLGFDDTMVVRELGARHARLEKTGRVVRGTTTIDVAPVPGGGSQVTWRQELSVTGMPWALPVRVAGRIFYRGLLRRSLVTAGMNSSR